MVSSVMALNKSYLFSPRESRLAALAKAISHPARIAIVRALLRRKACLCGELVEELPLAQATVSQHLQALREAGLIRSTPQGPTVSYRLNHRALRELARGCSALSKELERSESL